MATATIADDSRCTPPPDCPSTPVKASVQTPTTPSTTTSSVLSSELTGSISLSPSTAPSTPISRTSSPAFTTPSSSPTPSPSSLCKSRSCPIIHAHSTGIYPPKEQTPISAATENFFAPSIPPPDVTAAYDRCLQLDATEADKALVGAFHQIHTEPVLDDVRERWIAPTPLGIRRNDNRSWTSRHPFGFTNPPPIIWERYERAKEGKGSWVDEDLVESFCIWNAFVGEGTGEQEVMGKRWRVRKPGESALRKREMEGAEKKKDGEEGEGNDF